LSEVLSDSEVHFTYQSNTVYPVKSTMLRKLNRSWAVNWKGF